MTFALGDSGEAGCWLTVSKMPGGTGARAPRGAGETGADVPGGQGLGFESQLHPPTWKTVGPPAAPSASWGLSCLHPLLGEDRPALRGPQEQPTTTSWRGNGRLGPWGRGAFGPPINLGHSPQGAFPPAHSGTKGRDSGTPLSCHF